MEHEKNNEELMYIDLFALLRKTMLFLRRFWAMVLALSVLGGGLMYIRSVRAYRPMYKSEAMFSVSVHYSGSTDITGYSYYYDKAAAKLVTETFPYLLQSESTQELIRQKLGVSYINGAISSSSVADTNLFALTVTSPSAQDAYDIINAVMEVYPQVSRQVIGETQLVITREPLLSFAPYNALSWKSSVFKGAAAGFLLGMGLLVLMAISRRTVLSTGDVKKISNLSCLARIPEVRVKRRKLSTNNSLLVTRQESDSPFNESFRLLRLKLLRSLSKDDQVILFTSSVPAEGKSSLAVNTALTLAKDNKKVLLVDADLRGPSIKSLLNINKSSNGLGEYLSGGLDTVQFVRYENTKLFVFSGDETAVSVSGRTYVTSKRLIGSDDIVTIDLSPQVGDTWGDYARTLILQDGTVVETSEVRNPEWKQGLEMEELLHRELLAFAKPDTTFEELYFHINRLIEEKGFVNLDFAGNLGHSIARRKDDRIYTEKGNQARLGDVEHFTFEPHISLPGSKYGF